MSRTTRLALFCAAAALAALAVLPARAADSAPDSAPDAEALAALKSLSEKPGLSLGTGPDSGSEHFGVACRYQGRQGEREWAWDLWAVRDAKRVITMVRAGPGQGKMSTRAVVCDGVAVCLDPKLPGGLVVADGVWPSFRLLSEGGE